MRNLSEVYKKGLRSMSDLYKRIEELCKERKITITTMCKESGASRASLSDLKVGRKQSLSADTLNKIAKFFSVSVDYLLGNVSDPFFVLDNDTILADINSYEDKEKAPAGNGKRSVSDDDIKFALFGGDGEITDAMYQEVKEFAALVKLREDLKKSKE